MERGIVATPVVVNSRNNKDFSLEVGMSSEKLRKVRTSIPRTKNENFSHLISMGYQ